MSGRILVVDDEEIVVRSCTRVLAGRDYQVEAASDGAEALRRIEESPVDVLILDIMMPRISGLEVLQRVKEMHPDIDVIMVTGLSQIDTAVRSMKLGAFYSAAVNSLRTSGRTSAWGTWHWVQNQRPRARCWSGLPARSR